MVSAFAHGQVLGLDTSIAIHHIPTHADELYHAVTEFSTLERDQSELYDWGDVIWLMRARILYYVLPALEMSIDQATLKYQV